MEDLNLENLEKRLILKAINNYSHEGSTGICARLGISERTLFRKLKIYGTNLEVKKREQIVKQLELQIHKHKQVIKQRNETI